MTIIRGRGGRFSQGRSGTVIAATVLGLMLGGIIYRYWPSDERAIRRHLSNLAEALSTPAGETEVQHITRSAALREYFAPDVRVRVQQREETLSRESLIGAISRVPVPPSGLAVEFVDITVALAGDHASAEVGLTAKVSGTDSQTGQSTVDTRTVSGHMEKLNEDWVIASVNSAEPPPAPRP